MAVTKVGNLEWQIVGVGDFNGDGKADILWRNTRYGKNQIWRSASSSTISALATVGSQSWKVVGIGDFNGDGSTDILWRDTAAGRNAIRSEEHTSELQSLMRISYAVFCLKNKTIQANNNTDIRQTEHTH